MNDLRVELENGDAQFRPGETIEGTARWSLAEDPETLELRLFWFTQGKGDRDVGVVEITPIDGAGREGSRGFTFTAPAEPLSFSGKLISLVWAIELVLLPGGDAARRELMISRTGEEIRIDTSTGTEDPFDDDGSPFVEMKGP